MQLYKHLSSEIIGALISCGKVSGLNPPRGARITQVLKMLTWILEMESQPGVMKTTSLSNALTGNGKYKI